MELIPTARPVCIHHWVVAAPNGLTLRGQCKKCRKVRYFPASPEEVWQNPKKPLKRAKS